MTAANSSSHDGCGLQGRPQGQDSHPTTSSQHPAAIHPTYIAMNHSHVMLEPTGRHPAGPTDATPTSSGDRPSACTSSNPTSKEQSELSLNTLHTCDRQRPSPPRLSYHVVYGPMPTEADPNAILQQVHSSGSGHVQSSQGKHYHQPTLTPHLQPAASAPPPLAQPHAYLSLSPLQPQASMPSPVLHAGILFSPFQAQASRELEPGSSGSSIMQGPPGSGSHMGRRGSGPGTPRSKRASRLGSTLAFMSGPINNGNGSGSQHMMRHYSTYDFGGHDVSVHGAALRKQRTAGADSSSLSQHLQSQHSLPQQHQVLDLSAAVVLPGSSNAVAAAAGGGPPSGGPHQDQDGVLLSKEDLRAHSARAWLREYFAKWRGCGDHPLPRDTPAQMFWSWLGAFLSILLVSVVNEWLTPVIDLPMLVACFGASAVLVFGVPESKLAQPRNLVFGSLLSTVIGVVVRLVLGLCDLVWLSSALGMSLALLAMQMTQLVHPPGGAASLIAASAVSQGDWHGFKFVLTVLVGTVIMLLVALVVNNIPNHRRYPTFW